MIGRWRYFAGAAPSAGAGGTARMGGTSGVGDGDRGVTGVRPKRAANLAVRGAAGARQGQAGHTGGSRAGTQGDRSRIRPILEISPWS
ncbi:hypothetical protein GCM10009665_51150 [Kitasatospora nipponensis]|uniref:Uncharacterized protein n=1 Tax=Kitasatospora nipponensis TaxID=258049 RepID=A0ABN1WPV3_9ACTN